MKVRKKVTRTTVSERVVNIICDFCGVDWSPDGLLPKNKSYKKLPEETHECFEGGGLSYTGKVIVSYEYGDSFALDGGYSYSLDLDVCPTCWTDKILPHCKTPPVPSETSW